MKRILTWSLLVGLTFAIYGCEAWQKKNTPTDQGDKTEISNVKPETSPSEAAQPAEEPAPAPEAAAPGGGRTHVVARGDTIYKLARQYYNGDQSKWRVIWEANKAQLPNPNQLKPGQQLVIP